MTDKNPKPPDSPDNEFTNQWPMDLSEYLKFDDDQWPEDDIETLVSGHVPNQDNQANEVGDFGESGSGSHLEGSSSSSKPS